MADVGSNNGYKPGPDFEEDTRDPILPISLTDSTELWLIQWPLNQLKPVDFHGKELSLKLHRDGKLASFENSSGKSYELVSFSAQEPDATVLLPSSSDTKVVGKISRRVCLVHYPEQGEFDKSSFSNANLSNMRIESSRMTTLSHLSSVKKQGSYHGTDRSSHDTLATGPGIEQGSPVIPQKHSRKSKQEDRTSASESAQKHSRKSKHKDRTPASESAQKHSSKSKHKDRTPASESAMSAEISSFVSEPESQMINNALRSMQSHSEKSKKKKKIKFEV